MKLRMEPTSFDVNPLSRSALPAIRSGIALPGHDRSALARGIVHLGLGAFHRAHQALYTERLLAAGDRRWGILGVSLRDPGVVNTLVAQDYLYSVTEKHGNVARTQVVGALCGALFAPKALDQVLAAIANPQTSVVSCTVTEKGYSLNPATSDLDLSDPRIQHDLANPDTPISTLGVLAAGIRRRPAHAPLTLLCCDNMAGNGDVLRKLLVQYAGHLDAGLARRLESDIGMPNSMVDRIVPAATPDSLDMASAALGVRDAAAVVCEPFTQWVIEDRFTGPRPAWEDVGAVLTGDVRPYQEMKLRLLNGTHSAIAYIGQLCDLSTVSDAMAHPQVGAFVRRLMLEDLRASVACPPHYDLDRYCQDLLQRFANPTLAHKTEQIASDGSQKIPVRWLPALRESLARGAASPLLERALAIWLHYLQGQTSETGRPLLVQDSGAQELVLHLRRAANPGEMVHAALAQHKIFGIADWPQAFVHRLTGHLTTLRNAGMQALLSP
jgi:fructuronate reductase